MSPRPLAPLRALSRLRPLVRGPIAARLFVFNILLVFVPAAAFLSLAAFESSLLRSLEHALVQQGRFLAAWLGSEDFDEESSRSAVAALGRQLTARVRVVDSGGRLLADSSVDPPGSGAPAASSPVGRTMSDREEPSAEPAPGPAEETLLYRLFSLPVRLSRRWFLPPSPPLESADYYARRPAYDGPEIIAALAGGYGSATRISSGGQVSVTLYAALPVEREGRIEGAVLVSQSTYRILRELYALRLEVGKVFALGAAAACLVSLLLAWTISRPLSRLGRLAAATVGPDGRLENRFVPPGGRPPGKGDEIDRLATALGDLVERLRERLAWAERFSADAAHELRNPIAAVRSAAELLEGAEGEDRSRLLAAVRGGAARMERVVAGLRSLALAEAGEGADGPAAPATVARNVCLRLAPGGRGGVDGRVRLVLEVAGDAESALVAVDGEKLALAIGNLVENALSFAAGRVLVRLSIREGLLLLLVEDDGPGIPDGHRDRVFERFFSWRPGEEGGAHSGLGLSIVRAIALRAGGRAYVAGDGAEAGDGSRGARLALELPLLSRRPAR